MVSVHGINTSVGNLLSKTADMMSKGLEIAYKEPAKVAAKTMMISLVSKDAVNCAIYTAQSLTNEKIPEDKRRFVGYMDLINGAINVVGQVASFFLIDHFLTPKLQGLWDGKIQKNGEKATRSKSLYSGDTVIAKAAAYINNNKDALIKEGVKPDELLQNLPDIGKKLVKKLGNSSSRAKDITTGIGVIITALATTALIKRVITPLFATPLAAKMADSVNKKKEEEKKNSVNLNAVVESSNRYQNKPDKTAFSQFQKQA